MDLINNKCLCGQTSLFMCLHSCYLNSDMKCNSKYIIPEDQRINYDEKAEPIQMTNKFGEDLVRYHKALTAAEKDFETSQDIIQNLKNVILKLDQDRIDKFIERNAKQP